MQTLLLHNSLYHVAKTFAHLHFDKDIRKLMLEKYGHYADNVRAIHPNTMRNAINKMNGLQVILQSVECRFMGYFYNQICSFMLDESKTNTDLYI